MAFCGNCGYKLEENSIFCNECGMKQEGHELDQATPIETETHVNLEQSSEHGEVVAKKKGNWLPVIATIIICFIVVSGSFYYFFGFNGNDSEAEISAVEEVITLKDTLEWSFDAEKLQEIKTIKIIGYEGVNILQAFDKYDVKDWKYAAAEEQEYIQVNYLIEENTYIMVINATLKQVEEIFIDDVQCTPEEFTEITDGIFDVEAPFIGQSGRYTTVGATLNITIEGIVVNSEIWVDGYSVELVGKVVSETEAEVYLESGELIRYTWLDENKVLSTAVNGFSQEATSMIRLVCQALYDNVYTFESNDVNAADTNFVATYLPDIDYYTNSTDGGFPNTYSLKVSKVSNTTFTFTLTEELDLNGNGTYKQVITDGVASFTEPESYIAYYKEGDFDLTFDCAFSGIIHMHGYEPGGYFPSKFIVPN